MIRYAIWLLILIAFSCSAPTSEQGTTDISGDWWMVDPNGNYVEVYISENRAFSYNETIGLMPPKELKNVTDTTVGVMAGVGDKWLQVTSPIRFENDSTLVQEVTKITYNGVDTAAKFGYTQTYQRLGQRGKRLSDFGKADGAIKISQEAENVLLGDFLERMELNLGML